MREVLVSLFESHPVLFMSVALIVTFVLLPVLLDKIIN